ncbi:MAG: hypothetical protein KAJ12_09365, partial [Bacteroidetes bacterium]|nr:hypothetical protein [Bacteroidota bacterium]
MTAALIIVGWILGVAPGAEQDAARSSATLNIVIPATDTTITSVAKHRLAGNTTPGTIVRLNGKRLRVYPTGAFADLLELDVGENPFRLTAVDQQRDSISRAFVITRREPLTTTTTDSLVIEDTLMLPSVEYWLGQKDLLRVQFKGTPGCKAYFLDSIPMYEVPPHKGRGLRGIYRGLYHLDVQDSLENDPITFYLEDSLGNVVTKESPGRITCIEGRLPLTGVTIGERPYLNCGLGRDRLGGTKLAYIVPGIRLALTGKVGEQYIVSLADGMDAWIPEWMVELEPPGTYPPFSLTGAWI